ncbi:MAG: glycosyltransferase family 4 protein [Firmicutes bacterium]|nr:glycosyltransferase family 4 protein [Bacillota bacterium]
MRIGIFSDSYKPYISGVVISIENTVRELKEMGHEVYIFAPRYPEATEDEPGIFRFRSFRSPTNNDFSVAIPISLKMGSIIKGLDLDLIHVHSPFLLGRLGAVQARRMGIPLVFTYHTLYEQYVHYVPLQQDLTRRLTVQITRYFCNQCDTVITPTSKVKQILDDYGVKSPIEVLPTGIDLDRFKNGDRQWLRKKFGLSQGDKVLLFVGRLSKEKNLEFLIRAFTRIAGLPDVYLVLVAQGPEEDALKELVRDLGLGDRVIFAGRMVDDDLVNSYYGADLFVFPSVTETQGLVVVEAMATGLPVVALDAFGVSEMVDNGINGILTDHDLECFSSAVITLLRDEQMWKQMSENALKKAELLSAPVITSQLVEIYQRLINSKKRHRKAVEG